jgi:hypothetical protein
MDIEQIYIYKTDQLSNYIPAITLSLNNTSSGSGFIVRNITGLDADDIFSVFNGVDYTTNDKIFDMRLRPREIAINLILDPSYSDALFGTPAKLRDYLYKFISASRTSKIRLGFGKNDLEICGINGFITKIESDLNTLIPEVKLTIYCEDPYFESQQYAYVNLSAQQTYFTVTDNDSTSPHGFEMSVTILGDLYTFGLGNYQSYFSLNELFRASDQIVISSMRNNRNVELIRNGIRSNLISKLAFGSNWPIMFPGENTFNINGAGPFMYNVNYFRYRKTYWGI